MDTKPQSVVKTCRVCKTEKQIEQFLKGRNICSCCNNEQRRNKYSNDEELRKKLIGNAILTKQRKSQAKREQLLKEQEEIGWNNMECRYCFEIKPKDMENLYLVKNNMIRVPDAKLAKYLPKEIALIGKVELDELELINDVKKIFNGMLIK